MPPIHPLVIHFPIALFVIALLFDFMTAFRVHRARPQSRHELRAEISPLNSATRILMVVGFAGAVVAVASGEWLKGERGPFLPHGLISLHQFLAILFTVWYGLLLYIRLRKHWRPTKMYLSSMIVGFVLLTAVGHTGGEMAWPAGMPSAGAPQVSSTADTGQSKTSQKLTTVASPSSPEAKPVQSSKNTSDMILLKQGDRGAKVSQLQQQLSQLGYFSSPVTGYYGSGTSAAVRSFQTANHLSVTGNLDEMTANSILKVLGQKKTTTNGGNHTSTVTTTHSTSNTQVVTLNQARYNAGYRLFVSSCASCHSLSLATEYYGKLSNSQWTSIVNQMQGYAGGSIPDTQDIIYYLDHHN